jgi:hypothetical protein
VLDQGFPGLVVQLLEGGCLDADRGVVGLGGEVAWSFNQDAKDDLAHAGEMTFMAPPSLARIRVVGRAAAYGEPIHSTPRRHHRSAAASVRVQARSSVTMHPTREQILAASAGWVAVILNIIPGLGAGYLYQRRWRAYWITSALATAWFVAGAVLGQQSDTSAEARNQLVGLIGLLTLAAVTATEAGLAVKRVRQDT